MMTIDESVLLSRTNAKCLLSPDQRGRPSIDSPLVRRLAIWVFISMTQIHPWEAKAIDFPSGEGAGYFGPEDNIGSS